MCDLFWLSYPTCGCDYLQICYTFWQWIIGQIRLRREKFPIVKLNEFFSLRQSRYSDYMLQCSDMHSMYVKYIHHPNRTCFGNRLLFRFENISAYKPKRAQICRKMWTLVNDLAQSLEFGWANKASQVNGGTESEKSSLITVINHALESKPK